MSNWQLSEIKSKIRRVTGRLTSREISDNELVNYINQFYQYTFPAEVKLERAHTFYELITEPYVRSYTLPSGYTNFEPPGRINYQEISWYQDPATFQDQNPSLINSVTIGTGDGVIVAFVYTTGSFPITPGTLVINDLVETFEDTNTTWTTSNVTLTGSLGGTGTVNYTTGAISVSFATAPASADNVYGSWTNFQPGQPTAVLLYNNEFTFYTTPDKAYRFKVKAYANNLVTTSAGVTQPLFENATDAPLLDEWGPAIAYGTARDINANYGEMDAYKENTFLYKEQVSYILTRTLQNLLNTRSQPHF